MGRGLFPLDDERALVPGTLTPWLQASLVRLGSRRPLGHAAREVGWLSRAPGGVRVRESVAERLTEAAGAADVAEQPAAVERLERPPTPAPARPARRPVSADGAMLSLVNKPWGAGKTLAIGTIGPEPEGAARARAPAYCSRRTDHPAVRRLALVAAPRRGGGTAGVVGAVQDGADWLQAGVDCHRRAALRGLAFPHAVEYLTRASHAAFGAGTAATSAWLGQQAHARKPAGPEPVLAAGRVRPTGAPRDAARADRAPRLAQRQSPTCRAAG